MYMFLGEDSKCRYKHEHGSEYRAPSPRWELGCMQTITDKSHITQSHSKLLHPILARYSSSPLGRRLALEATTRFAQMHRPRNHFGASQGPLLCVDGISPAPTWADFISMASISTLATNSGWPLQVAAVHSASHLISRRYPGFPKVL